MSGKFGILQSASLAGFAILMGLSVAGDASAQSCDPPGAAATAATGTIVPQIVTQATSIINNLQNLIGPVTSQSGLGNVGSGANLVTGGCGNLVSCMQMYFSQLGSTNTNNQTMTSSVLAKGNDYLATNQYALTLQSAQAQMAVKNGVSTGQNNNLQYMNNLSCTSATLASGATQASVQVDQAVATDPIKSGSYQYPQSGPSPGYAFSNHSSVKDINLLFNTAKPFYALGQTGHTDSDIKYLMGEDVFTTGGSTSDVNSMTQFIAYFLGLQPEPPAGGNTPESDAQDVANTIAASEKTAFWSLAAWPINQEAQMHTGFTNSASQNITDLYTASNAPVNIGGAATVNGQTSRASFLKAMFRFPGEDTNTFVNIKALGSELAALQYIAGIMVLGNYLNYERYLVERENLLVNDGILSLQMRQMDFASHP